MARWHHRGESLLSPRWRVGVTAVKRVFSFVKQGKRMIKKGNNIDVCPKHSLSFFTAFRMTTSRSFCVMGKHLYYCLYRTHVILIFHLPLGRKFRRTSSVLNICTPPLPTPTIYPLAKESIPLGSGLFQLLVLLVQTKRFCHCQGVNANDYMELNRLYSPISHLYSRETKIS